MKYINIILKFEGCSPDEAYAIVRLGTYTNGIDWTQVVEGIESGFEEEKKNCYGGTLFVENVESVLNEVCEKYECRWDYVEDCVPMIVIP